MICNIEKSKIEKRQYKNDIKNLTAKINISGQSVSLTHDQLKELKIALDIECEEQIKQLKQNLDNKNNKIYELLEEIEEHKQDKLFKNRQISRLTKREEFLINQLRENMEGYREDIKEISHDFDKFKTDAIEKYLLSLLEIFNKLIELSEKKGEINYKKDILKMIDKLRLINNQSNEIFRQNIENIITKEEKEEYKELYQELRHVRDSMEEYLDKFKSKIKP